MQTTSKYGFRFTGSILLGPVIRNDSNMNANYQQLLSICNGVHLHFSVIVRVCLDSCMICANALLDMLQIKSGSSWIGRMGERERPKTHCAGLDAVESHMLDSHIWRACNIVCTHMCAWRYGGKLIRWVTGGTKATPASRLWEWAIQSQPGDMQSKVMTTTDVKNALNSRIVTTRFIHSINTYTPYRMMENCDGVA